jgi:hypothetical protein
MIKMASRITSATKSPMSRRMPDGMRIERWKRGPTTPARVHGGGSEGRGQSQQHARFSFSACPKPLGQQLSRLSRFVVSLHARVRCTLDSASYQKLFYDGKVYIYPGGSAFYHQSKVPSVLSSISDKYKTGLHLFQNRSRGRAVRIITPGRTVVSPRVLTPTEDGSQGDFGPARVYDCTPTARTRKIARFSAHVLPLTLPVWRFDSQVIAGRVLEILATSF